MKRAGEPQGAARVGAAGRLPDRRREGIWLGAQDRFAGIVAFTIYVIIDIEYPRLGWVRLDAIAQLLVDMRAGMR